MALVVSLAHALNDAYAAFIPPLLPRIMDRLGLSIALAAALAMTFSISSSILQPLAGYLADRHGRRLFVVAGPLLSGVFVSLIGLAPHFWILVGILALGGLGSAVFHPPGASYAARVSEGRGSGLRLSVFSFGGSAGYALGPLIAVGLVHWRGLGGMWIAMLPAIVLAPIFFLGLPRARAREPSAAQRPPAPGELLRALRGPLGLVFGISAILAFGQRLFLTMEPIAVAQVGGSEALGALALSTFLAAQTAGSLVGGFLTDRMDRQRLLLILCILEVPALAAALGLAPGSAGALVAAAAAGFVGMACLPPIVVTAQEILPRGAAVGSGIVMGLAWATGSVGVLGTGALADILGPQPAALASVPALLVAVFLATRPGLARAEAARS